MTTLSELLVEGTVRDVCKIRQLPSTSLIKELNRTMRGSLENILPDKDVIAESITHLKSCSNTFEIGELSSRELKNTVYGIFLDDNYQGFDKNYIEEYLNVLCEKGKKIIFRALYQVYVDTFVPESWVTSLLSVSIKRLEHLANRELSLTIGKYQLLETEQVSSLLGELALSHQNPKLWLENQFGVTNGATYNSLGYAAMQGAMKYLSHQNAPIDSDSLQRIQNWVAVDDSYSFKFGNHFIIDGIMLNCINNRNQIEEDTRKKIENFLLKIFKDPRFTENRISWNNVNKDAKKEFIRWLTNTSLDIFLEIIGQTAYPVHWQRRKEFWSKYMDANYVDEAYVVLGPDANYKARKLYQQTQNEAYKGCGFLQNPTQSDQSALLMRMGNVYISEGSHNKTLHIWKSSTEAPEFYQRNYYRSDLESHSDFSTPHDHYGRWCDKAASFIKKASGNRIRDLS